MLNSGYEFVASGGSADVPVIDSGGFVYVASGGSIDGATLSGGDLELASGSVVGSTPLTFSSGGDLIFEDSVAFTGLVAGFGASDYLDLVDIRFVASGASATTVSWTQLTSGASASGTLMVAEGGHTANITLLGQYMQANFSIGAGNFGGTLVTDPPVLASVTSSLVLASPHHT